MSDLLANYRPDPVDPESFRPSEREPALAELFAAGSRLAQDDAVNAQEVRLRDAYAPMLEAINARRRAEGKAALTNPGNPFRPRNARFRSEEGGLGTLFADPGGFWGVTTEEQEAAVFGELARLRRADPTFLSDAPADPAALRAAMLKRVQARRAADQRTAAAGGGLADFAAGFAGGVVGSFHDPVNVLTLPLGGGGKTILGAAAREAAVNGLLEAAVQPLVGVNRESLGETLTTGEALANVGFAAVGGGAFGAGGKALELAAPAIGRAVGETYDAAVERAFTLMPEAVQRRWADAARVPDGVLGQALAAARGDLATPDERAAAAVLVDLGEIERASPWPGGDAADAEHAARLGDALAAFLEDRPVPARVAPARARLTSGTALGGVPRETFDAGGAVDRFLPLARQAESGGDDAARSATSSASGRYQFTDETWERYYRRRFGATGESRAAILAHKTSGAMQEALMRDLTADNAAALARAGFATTNGNLYLAHFAGQGGALKLLRAAPGTPVERIFGPRVIAANRRILAGKTAGEVVEWAHRLMGARTGRAAAPSVDAGGAGADALRGEAAALRAEAAALEAPPAVEAGAGAGEAAAPAFDAPELAEALPAPLVLVDEAPVDEAVAAPPAGGSLLERADPLVEAVLARARQRGLSLQPAKVARDLGVERDVAEAALGLAASRSRLLVANRRGGFQRVGRGGPADLLTWIARNGGLRRSGIAEAAEATTPGHDLPGMGADKVIPFAGRLLRDDGMTLGEAAERLWEEGYFHTLTSEDTRPDEGEMLVLLQRALDGERIYSRADLAEAEDRRVDGANRAALREAEDRVDGVAYGRDVELSAADRREAAALVARGWSPDDAIDQVMTDEAGDVLDAAEAEGLSLDEMLDVVFGGGDGRGDLSEARADRGSSDGDTGAAGARGSFAEEYAGADADEAWRTTFDAVDPGQWERWDDPAGDAAREQLDDLEHDYRASPAVDPNIADRQRQETQLRAAAPLRADADQVDTTIGLGLFDASDQPTFRLEAEGDETTPRAVLDALDAERAAIARARACLDPGDAP